MAASDKAATRLREPAITVQLPPLSHLPLVRV